MKEMDVIRSEALQVALAAQRILNLANLGTKRQTDRPELMIAITRQELEQFKHDDRIVSKRYDGFVALFATDLLTSRAFLQCS
jgi:hypothetical protein